MNEKIIGDKFKCNLNQNTIILYYTRKSTKYLMWNSAILSRLQHVHAEFNDGLWFHKIEITYLRDDVIKWKQFPRYWPFVRWIHRSPVNSPHKGQWRGALMFSLICAWINGSVNNRKAGDLRSYCAHYDVIVILSSHNTLYIHGSALLGCHMK